MKKFMFVLLLFVLTGFCFSDNCTYTGGYVYDGDSWFCGHVPFIADDVYVDTQILTIQSALTCNNFYNDYWLFVDGANAVITCNNFYNTGSISALVGNHTYGRIIIASYLIGSGNIADVSIQFDRMLAGDITGDGEVNLYDLAVLANNWLTETQIL